MLNWIITFFIMAIVSSFFGFWGLAGTFAEVARFLAFIFVMLFVASLVYTTLTDSRPTPPPV